MNDSISQWQVQLAPVHENVAEKQEPKLIQHVNVTAERKLAFEISCNEPGEVPESQWDSVPTGNGDSSARVLAFRSVTTLCGSAKVKPDPIVLNWQRKHVTYTEVKPMISPRLNPASTSLMSRQLSQQVPLIKRSMQKV